MPKPRRPREAQLPDVRDGLNPLERAILTVLAQLRHEREAHVASFELYGRVCERVDVSLGEFQAALTRLARRR